jgi:hypothetical protein
MALSTRNSHHIADHLLVRNDTHPFLSRMVFLIVLIMLAGILWGMGLNRLLENSGENSRMFISNFKTMEGAPLSQP